MTPRGEILATAKAALSNLPSLPDFHDSYVDVLKAESQRSLVVGPGDEEAIEGETHAGATVRKYPLRVVCTAWSREGADQIALEVEAAMALEAGSDRLGARLAGTAFTEDGRGERVYFATIVNYEVLYEAAAPA